MPPPEYTWDVDRRQYRTAADDRLVPWPLVRDAMEAVIDRARLEAATDDRAYQSGRINVIEWRLRQERRVRELHVAAATIAHGGRAQMGPRELGSVGARVRAQYGHLGNFAYQADNGLIPLDGRFSVRMAQYLSAARGTFEASLRSGTRSGGNVLAERRRLGAVKHRHCPSCLYYHALGWQPPGVLPDVGQQCECLANCRCTFEFQVGSMSVGGIAV